MELVYGNRGCLQNMIWRGSAPGLFVWLPNFRGGGISGEKLNFGLMIAVVSRQELTG